MKQGFTDIHCHVVYDIDDGPRTLRESLAMLKKAHDDGVRTIVATSHICPGVLEFQEELYRARVEELRNCCVERGLDLRILTGTEILYSSQTCRFLREGRALPLGESDRVLVEFSPSVRYGEMKEALTGILRNGYHPILAHVERYGCLIGSLKRMLELKERWEVALQMNCSTVLGGKNWLLDRVAKRALDEDLIDVVASDAHNVSSRPTRMQESYKLLRERYGQERAEDMLGVRWGEEIGAFD